MIVQTRAIRLEALCHARKNEKFPTQASQVSEFPIFKSSHFTHCELSILKPEIVFILYPFDVRNAGNVLLDSIQHLFLHTFYHIPSILSDAYLRAIVFSVPSSVSSMFLPTSGSSSGEFHLQRPHYPAGLICKFYLQRPHHPAGLICRDINPKSSPSESRNAEHHLITNKSHPAPSASAPTSSA